MIRIQVVENNYKKTKINKEDPIFPLEVECSTCGSIISIDKEDLRIGWLGAQHFTCPCCGEESMVDELDGITLTINNLEFPKHFLRTNKDIRNTNELDSKTIIKYIREGILYLRKYKDEFAVVTGSGDTMVHVYRYDNDETYQVIVSKDYYDTDIPFEDVDYAGNDNIADRQILFVKYSPVTKSTFGVGY